MLETIVKRHVEWVNLRAKKYRNRFWTVRSEMKNFDNVLGTVDFRSYRFMKPSVFG